MQQLPKHLALALQDIMLIQLPLAVVAPFMPVVIVMLLNAIIVV